MENLINDPKALLALIPAFLVALNSFLKKMGMNEYWCPLVNLVGGLTALPFLLDMGCKPISGVLISLMVGLSAGGFFDFIQKTVKRE
jgi:hypothetical protein